MALALVICYICILLAYGTCCAFGFWIWERSSSYVITFFIYGFISIFFLWRPLLCWLYVRYKRSKAGGSLEEENEKVVTLLRRGDHIYTDRRGNTYNHHGIFVDQGTVIHFQNTGKAVGISSARVSPAPPLPTTICEKCSYNPNDCKGGVVKTCLDCFLNGHSLYVRKYLTLAESESESVTDNHHQRFSPSILGIVWIGDKGNFCIQETTLFYAIMLVKQLTGVVVFILLFAEPMSLIPLYLLFFIYLYAIDVPTTILWGTAQVLSNRRVLRKFKTQFSSSSHFNDCVLGSYRLEYCTLVSHSPDQVIEDATELLNNDSFGKYSLLNNNCEHFVVLCKTGMAVSSQVEVMKKLTLIKALSHQMKVCNSLINEAAMLLQLCYRECREAIRKPDDAV